MKIIPTIFAYNKKEFNERFEKLIKLRRDLHIDFMDGRFVKSRGLNVSDVPDLKKFKIKFEAHLMCLNPAKYIDELKKKGFDKIVFHYEAVDEGEISKLIAKIRKKSMKAWIAINPSTGTDKIAEFLHMANGILLMGVYPGREHQKFASGVLKKIEKLRKISKKVKIQVDGGVNLTIAGKLRKLGVDYANSGSFIADSENPKAALKELE